MFMDAIAFSLALYVPLKLAEIVYYHYFVRGFNMKKYGDLWVFQDTDNRYYIAGYYYGAGTIHVKPYSFESAESAERCKNNLLSIDV